MRKEYDCPACANDGGDGYIKVLCQSCAGSGEGMADGTTCQTCKGAGELERLCEECDGNGTIHHSDVQDWLDCLWFQLETKDRKIADLESALYLCRKRDGRRP